jgi:hypothetical protein
MQRHRVHERAIEIEDVRGKFAGRNVELHEGGYLFVNQPDPQAAARMLSNPPLSES